MAERRKPSEPIVEAIRSIMARPFDRPASRAGRSGWIMLTACIGLLAGIGGGLLGLLLVFPEPTIAPTLSLRSSGTAGTTEAMPEIAPVAAAVVDIFHVRRDGPLPEQIAFRERTGRGVALTSDGWVVTLREALPTRRTQQPVIATSDRRLHAVARIAYDPISDLAFLHVPTLAAPVLPLRDDRDLRVGASLFAPIPNGGMLRMALVERSVRREETALIHSSDVWESALGLNSAGSVVEGTVVVDSAGAMVGIARDAHSAIPVRAVTSALPSLFSDGAVTRNTLGVTYRDTSEFASSGSRVPRGVLLAGAGGASPFSNVSPLKGALAAGDSLLAIGDDPLTANRHLASLLQEYPIGGEIVIHATHAGEERSVEATLVKVSGEVVVFDDGDGP